MIKQTTRLPRFSRFEYIGDLLNEVSKGATWDIIEQRLTMRKKEFERLKFLATGKGKRILSKSGKSKDLTNDCISLAVKTELITKNDSYELTKYGQKLLDVCNQLGIHDIDFKMVCLQRYFVFYPFVLDILFALSKRKNAEIDFPDTRHVKHSESIDIEKIFGVKTDVVSMMVIRDIFNQCGLINWKQIKIKDLPFWRIFLTCKISSENKTIKNLKVEKDNLLFFLTLNEPTFENFEMNFWEKYMELSENNSDLPVYYWDLRIRVCEELRISDYIYDIYFKQILKSENLRVIWSAGAIPSGNTQGNLLKNLPPRKDDEFWMVYVSVSKKEKP